MEKKHWRTILNSMGFVVHYLAEPCKCGRDNCEENLVRGSVLMDIAAAYPEALKASGLTPDDHALAVKVNVVELDADEEPIFTGQSGHA
jgi:hypothetical protein